MHLFFQYSSPPLPPNPPQMLGTLRSLHCVPGVVCSSKTSKSETNGPNGRVSPPVLTRSSQFAATGEIQNHLTSAIKFLCIIQKKKKKVEMHLCGWKTPHLISSQSSRRRSLSARWEGFYEPFPLQSNCFPDGGRTSEFHVQTPSFGAPSLTSGCSGSAFVFGSAHCDGFFFFLGGVSGSRVGLVLITASRERS